MIPDLSGARATATSTLTDRCTITRTDRSTARTVNPTTLAIEGPPDVVVWSGPCSVSLSRVGDRTTGTGATQSQVTTPVVRIPHDTPSILPGDAVTVTDIGPQGDPDLIDRTFTVESVSRRTTTVLRRLTCKTVSPADGVPT